MVNSQAVQNPVFEPSQDEEMSILKHPLVFHPQAGERVDIEEAAVAEFPRSGAPIGQAIVLAFKQSVQGLLIAVKAGDDRVDRWANFSTRVDQAFKTRLKNVLVAVAPSYALTIGRGGERQASEGIAKEG